MKKQTTPEGKSKQIPIWSIKGPNWTWKKQAPNGACPMELATQALEDIWSKDDKMQDKIQKSWLKKGHDQPSLGLSIFASHSQMKTKGQHILVCSITALANAAHHKESNQLKRLAQKA